MINNNKHIVIDAAAGSFRCLNCKSHTKIKLPKSLKEIIRDAKLFAAKREKCTPKLIRFKERVDWEFGKSEMQEKN